MGSAKLHQNIIDCLYGIYKTKGFITEDAVLDTMVEADVPIYDIDRVCERLLSMGVIILNDRDAYIDEESDEEYDRSRSDYDQIFADVLSIDENLILFIEQIRLIQPPQHREWRNIIPQAKGGNEYAHQRLVEMYIRTVVKISLSFHKKLFVPLAETIQEGCIGLITAVIKYEIGRQDVFPTYFTWWVRQNIMRETPLSINPSVYFPVHVKDKLFSVWDIIAGHECNECGKCGVCPQLVSFVSEALQCSAESAITYIGYFEEFFSIEELCNIDPMVFSDQGSFMEYHIEVYARKELVATIDKMLTILTPKEKRILQLRFGLKGGKEHTLEEIGSIYKLTRERIRQIEAKAIKKLRLPKYAKILETFM